MAIPSHDVNVPTPCSGVAPAAGHVSTLSFARTNLVSYLVQQGVVFDTFKTFVWKRRLGSCGESYCLAETDGGASFVWKVIGLSRVETVMKTKNR